MMGATNKEDSKSRYIILKKELEEVGETHNVSSTYLKTRMNNNEEVWRINVRAVGIEC
jgi:hypothetical protein